MLDYYYQYFRIIRLIRCISSISVYVVFTACCALFAASWMLHIACCMTSALMSSAARCLSDVVCCSLSPARHSLRVDCCLFSAACCPWCPLHVARWRWFAAHVRCTPSNARYPLHVLCRTCLLRVVCCTLPAARIPEGPLPVVCCKLSFAQLLLHAIPKRFVLHIACNMLSAAYGSLLLDSIQVQQTTGSMSKIIMIWKT